MNCPLCGTDASYIEDYSRWYCYQCKEYLEEGAQEVVEAVPSANVPGPYEVIEFPAVVYMFVRGGTRVNPSTGWSKQDIDWFNGKFTWLPSKSEPCRCFINKDMFYAHEFNKVIKSGIGIVPGVSIPVSAKQKMGKPFADFHHGEVMDFSVHGHESLSYFCVNTVTNFVAINPIVKGTIEQAGRNKEMIKKCQMLYEAMGINSPDPDSIWPNYYTPLSQYLRSVYEGKEQAGLINKAPGAQIPWCGKHKMQGTYVREYRKYFCTACKGYLD